MTILLIFNSLANALCKQPCFKSHTILFHLKFLTFPLFEFQIHSYGGKLKESFYRNNLCVPFNVRKCIFILYLGQKTSRSYSLYQLIEQTFYCLCLVKKLYFAHGLLILIIEINIFVIFSQ